MILVGFVSQCILCSSYGSFTDLPYSEGLDTWIIVVRYIFQLYPPFCLSKAYYDISAKAINEIDSDNGVITKAVGFTWDDLFARRVVNIFDVNVLAPPTINALQLLALQSIVYLVLALYFDYVIERQAGLFFFFKPSFWCIIKEKGAKGWFF
jgi:hypothetical protein